MIEFEKKKKKKKKNKFKKIEKYVEKFWQKIGDVISAQRLISCLCVPHPIICIESEMNLKNQLTWNNSTKEERKGKEK